MMGLFGYIKALSHGGNFGLIPRNWTYIYLRLFQQHKDCFADPSAIMTAASVINANAYLDTRGLRMDDLDHILDYALAGTCGPVRSMPTQDEAVWSIRHRAPGSFMDSGEASYDLILNYCVQYTAVLLAIDTPQFSARRVVESCITAKPKIENSIASLNRDLSRGAGNSYIWNAAAAKAVELDSNSCTTKYMLKLIKGAPEVQEFPQGAFSDTSGNRKPTAPLNCGENE